MKKKILVPDILYQQGSTLLWLNKEQFVNMCHLDM